MNENKQEIKDKLLLIELASVVSNLEKLTKCNDKAAYHVNQIRSLLKQDGINPYDHDVDTSLNIENDSEGDVNNDKSQAVSRDQASDVANEMFLKKIISANQIESQINDIMQWNQSGLSAFLEILSKR
jgi:hypothetical protein